MIPTGKERRLLVIAPHADDEVLGCGGYMAKVVAEGGDVMCVVASIGDIHFLHLNRVVTIEERVEEYTHALEALGVKNSAILTYGKESILETYPSGKMVRELDLVQQAFQPTEVLLPLPSFHQDHVYMWNVCIAATRPSAAKHSPNIVAAYEYPAQCWGESSSYDAGRGGMYVNVSDYFDKKCHALSKYTTQMREEGHLISIEGATALARLRGLESGYKYAELFHTLRIKMD